MCALAESGIVVLDNFLRDRCYADLGGAAAEEAPLIARAGAVRAPVRPAKLGRGDRVWSSAAVRGDEMAWLSAPEGEGLRARAEQRVLARLTCREAQRDTKGAAAREAPAAAAGAAAGAAPEFADLSQQLKAAFAQPAAARVESGAGRGATGGYAGAAGGAASGAAGGAASGAAGGAAGGSAGAARGAAVADDPSSAADGPGADGPCDEEAYQDLDVYLTRIIQLREEMDGELGFGSKRTSVMVARYPGGGARYARHRDALPEHEGSQRRLTAVFRGSHLSNTTCLTQVFFKSDE